VRSLRATAGDAETLLAGVCRLREEWIVIVSLTIYVIRGGVFRLSFEFRSRAGYDDRDLRVGVADPVIRIARDDVVKSTREMLCAGQVAARYLGVWLRAGRSVMFTASSPVIATRTMFRLATWIGVLGALRAVFPIFPYATSRESRTYPRLLKRAV